MASFYLALGYAISLGPLEAEIVALVVIVALLGWSWGALLKAGLGISRWYGLLLLLPVVNLVAFVAAGYAAHRRLVDAQNEAAYEKVKRLIEEASANETAKVKPE